MKCASALKKKIGLAKGELDVNREAKSLQRKAKKTKRVLFEETQRPKFGVGRLVL